MKRAREDAVTGDNYELRNAKVARKGPLPYWFLNALGKTDTWWIVTWFQKQAHWKKEWFNGRLQIFNAEFDSGEVFLRSWNIGKSTLHMFNTWWEFLNDVKKKKHTLGIWGQLTIASSRYWTVYSKSVHKWESFHIGVVQKERDVLATGWEVNDGDYEEYYAGIVPEEPKNDWILNEIDPREN